MDRTWPKYHSSSMSIQMFSFGKPRIRCGLGDDHGTDYLIHAKIDFLSSARPPR